MMFLSNRKLVLAKIIGVRDTGCVTYPSCRDCCTKLLHETEQMLVCYLDHTILKYLIDIQQNDHSPYAITYCSQWGLILLYTAVSASFCALIKAFHRKCALKFVLL